MRRVLPAGSRKGLSLIELLVVLAILAVVAGMVVSMTNGLDSRTRYDDTARRLGEIRSAILGPDAVSTGGDLLSGGYLQDVGWLPDSGADLLRPPEISPGTAMPALVYDATWKTWFGWRGPYLAAPPARTSGGVALYDGWGSDFYGWFAETSSSHSWELPRLTGSYAIRSMGSDAVKDADGGKTGVYEKDYPLIEQPLITESDWVSDLHGLQVMVTNLTGVDYSAAPVQVRFRIIVPRWNRAGSPLGYWPASPDADEFIGKAFTLDLAPVGDPLGRNQKTFDFTDAGRALRVPNGRRMLFLVKNSDGQPLGGVQAHAELLLSRRLSPPSCAKLMIRN